MKNLFRKYSLFFRIGFTIILFYILYLITDLNPNELLKTISNAESNWIIIAFIIFNVSIFFSSFRWWYILRILSLKAPIILCVISYYRSYFMNNFLPSSVGGDLSRIYSVGKYFNDSDKVITTVILERVLGLISLVFIAGIGMLFLDLDFYLEIANLIILVLLTLFLFSLVNPISNQFFLKLISKIPFKFKRSIHNIVETFQIFSKEPQKLIISLFLSIVFRFVEGLFVWAVVKSLKIDFSIEYVIVLQSIVNVIKFLPVTINGLGLSEGTWVALTVNTNIGEEKAILISLTAITVSIINSLIGGVLFLKKTRTSNGNI
ncbi:MAG: flippase-like domain-containing protein [Candidatus Delongbacteria bacterium]|nr:flippase-like domain-containing protein [Candidatus Delongbacteria bacterium]MBN2835091.1 flippase-like domain-containing protein [Candidatus Delongbacteria bacterium]